MSPVAAWMKTFARSKMNWYSPGPIASSEW